MKYFLALILFLIPFALFGEKFHKDDPVLTDPDMRSSPKPVFREIGPVYDFYKSTFKYSKQNKKNPAGRAVNINTLGDIPDSSWFTNRLGSKPMTIDEIVKGPNLKDAPDNSIWTIVQAKSQGVTPGFVIQDGRGDIYVIKFDPLNNPQLASSAEVISTKFFHAFGYNVPENYLALMTPEILLISPTAIITDENGQKRKMTDKDLNAILKRVPVNEDGTIQVIASKQISGEPLGPFSFHGVRSDDANDIFPHQDRRELRGLKVFASWLNHYEANSPNSLDVFESSGNSGYVKHYLLDFNSTLGSDNIRIKEKRQGNEYIVEWGPILKSAASLGLADRAWRSVDYPDYPSVGRFESQFFDPAEWRTNYPNPAFERMQAEDGFWAAKILMKMENDLVRAVVKTGRYTNPKVEEYVVQTLLQRRDKIIRYYATQVNPISDFTVDGNNLSFSHWGIHQGIGTVGGYQYQWHSFDNQTENLTALGDIASSSTRSIPLPSSNSEYLMVRVQGIDPSIPAWSGKVDVYIRTSDHKVVGIER